MQEQPILHSFIKFLKLYFITFILLVISRIGLFFFNISYFSLSFSQFIYYIFAGLRFDVSAISYCLSLYSIFYFLPIPYKDTKVFRLISFLFYIVPLSLFLLANFIDFVYFKYNYKRLTYDVFSFVQSIQSELPLLMIQFLKDFWFIIIIWGAFIYLTVRLYKKFGKPIVVENHSLFSYLKNALLLICIVLLFVVGIRGGTQRKPINIASAGLYASSFYTPLVLNSPFTIIRTIGREALEEKHFFDNKDEMYQHFSMFKHYHTDSNCFENKNVVLIILESFSNEHLNSIQSQKTISDENYAPFLDSLIHHGIFFPNMFANGKRSAEGIPSIISAVPSLMNTAFINSIYVNNSNISLPNILKKKNYKSYFFHGGHNGTINLDSYAMLAGFDKYYGKNEYNNNEDFDGYWGIWDAPYLQYVAKMLAEKTEPFFSVIYTLSSHHPFNVPEQYKNTLPDGPLPIHKTIAYTDLALKNFFTTISNSSWYNNSVFIITSDHSSIPYLDYYKSLAGMYSIPFLIYEPAFSQTETIYSTVQQTDIMPTILDYLKYDEPFVSYGNSSFRTSEPHFSISFINNVYQIISDSILVKIANNDLTEMYDMKQDILQQNNIVESENYNQFKANILNIYKSYIQQFNNSMIYNNYQR